MTDRAITMKMIECFLAVRETRHFRRAAELCGITQPSLSVQIQNLEEVLGLRLVERSRAGVTLTMAGRELADRALQVRENIQAMIDYADVARAGLSGTLRLGTTSTIGPYLLPHLVAKLHKSYPDLNLYVREGAPRHLEQELAAGRHDLLLTQLPMTSSDHQVAELFNEPLYLAMATDHPLADKQTNAVRDLRGIDVLGMAPDYPLFDQVNELCRSIGANLVTDYEGTSLDALRTMVGMGMGVAFFPALYCRSEITSRAEVAYRLVKGRQILRPIGLVWRKTAGRSSAFLRIADLIRELSAKQFPELQVISR